MKTQKLPDTPTKRYRVKTIVKLLLPVVFLIVLAMGLDERNRVVYGQAKIVLSDNRPGIVSWRESKIEMEVNYNPSFIRRAQLGFTKYPQIYPIIGETYLMDESGKRYDKYTLSNGVQMNMFSNGGGCKWKDCGEDEYKNFSLSSHSFPYNWTFPFGLNQIPKSAGKVFLHTQFESYGTPQKESTILVRE